MLLGLWNIIQSCYAELFCIAESKAGLSSTTPLGLVGIDHANSVVWHRYRIPTIEGLLDGGLGGPSCLEDTEHLVEVLVGNAVGEEEATQGNAIFIMPQIPDEHIPGTTSIDRHSKQADGAAGDRWRVREEW